MVPLRKAFGGRAVLIGATVGAETVLPIMSVVGAHVGLAIGERLGSDWFGQFVRSSATGRPPCAAASGRNEN